MSEHSSNGDQWRRPSPTSWEPPEEMEASVFERRQEAPRATEPPATVADERFPTQQMPPLPDYLAEQAPTPGPQSYVPPPRQPVQQPQRPPYLPQQQRQDYAPERRGRSGGSRMPFGVGTFFGVAGLVCFLMALLVLPWFKAAGEDVGLSDLRESFTLPETDAGDVISGADNDPNPEQPANADEVGDQAKETARDAAAGVAADAIDSGKSKYLELYTETIWIAVALGITGAVALSMLIRSRVLSTLLVMAAAPAHAVALWVVFSNGGPDPAFGVWLGVAGLVAVFVGCILGGRRKLSW